MKSWGYKSSPTGSPFKFMFVACVLTLYTLELQEEVWECLEINWLPTSGVGMIRSARGVGSLPSSLLTAPKGLCQEPFSHFSIRDARQGPGLGGRKQLAPSSAAHGTMGCLLPSSPHTRSLHWRVPLPSLCLISGIQRKTLLFF